MNAPSFFLKKSGLRDVSLAVSFNEMYLIDQLLERYIGVLVSRGYPIDKYLNPGLTRSLPCQTIARTFFYATGRNLSTLRMAQWCQ